MSAGGGTQLRGRLACTYVFVCLPSAALEVLRKGLCFPPLRAVPVAGFVSLQLDCRLCFGIGG